MQKALLSSAQRGHSLVAGVVGHVLFSFGWLLVGFVVLWCGVVWCGGGWRDPPLRVSIHIAGVTATASAKAVLVRVPSASAPSQPRAAQEVPSAESDTETVSYTHLRAH